MDKRSIGGSDIATIMGLNPWQSQWDLLARIVDGTEAVRSDDSLEKMRWGNLLEATVAQEWIDRYGALKTWTKGETVYPYHWARVTPDYVAHGELLEVKTTSERAKEYWGAADSEDIPENYRCQVQWYMRHLDIPVCHVAVLFGGQNLVSYTVPRDRAFGEKLMDAGYDWWVRHVEQKAPLPVDSSQSCCDALVRQYHAESRYVRVASEDEGALIYEYAQLRDQIQSLTARKDLLANELRLRIKDDYGLQFGATKITAPVVHASYTRWRSVAEELARYVDAGVIKAAREKHTSHSTRRDIKCSG